MFVRHFCCAAALLFALGMTARAGLVVTVGDLSLQAGSSGLIPVYLSSASGTTNIASTSFEFRITTGGATQLDFISSPDPSLDPTFSDTQYVFFAHSSFQDFNLPLAGASTTIVPNDTLIGGDSYSALGDISVPTTALTLTDNLLLAYLPVTTLTSLTPASGDTFTITLVPLQSSSSNPTTYDGNTGFADSNGNFIAFNSNAGTVTILPATAAVPEPGTFGLMLAGAIGMLWARRRQGCRALPSAN